MHESESADFSRLFDNEGLLKVTGSYKYIVNVVISRKRCMMESLLICYCRLNEQEAMHGPMAYYIVAIPVTLSDLHGHSPAANFSNVKLVSK